MMEICGYARKFGAGVGPCPVQFRAALFKVKMPNKKTYFQKFVEIAACISLLLGIFTFIRGDVSAKTRVEVDVDTLKQAAPGIEKRLDDIEKVQASMLMVLDRLEKKIDNL